MFRRWKRRLGPTNFTMQVCGHNEPYPPWVPQGMAQFQTKQERRRKCSNLLLEGAWMWIMQSQISRISLPWWYHSDWKHENVKEVDAETWKTNRNLGIRTTRLGLLGGGKCDSPEHQNRPCHRNERPQFHPRWTRSWCRYPCDRHFSFEISCTYKPQRRWRIFRRGQ